MSCIACNQFKGSDLSSLDHPILPFCFFDIRVSKEALKSFILRKKGLFDQPRTLGEHLRNRRLELGFRQEDVAVQLGTLREVYERWERDERTPVVSEWPGILSFLGYYPDPEETTANLVLKTRRYRGMDQKRLAQVIGVIHQRLRDWELGKSQPTAEQINQLKQIAGELLPSYGNRQPQLHNPRASSEDSCYTPKTAKHNITPISP
ncbi:helix-turn-helix transcriptional regulator, partial [Prosthecobacter sp.]|uniref:helix-turn-helix domain-containing protein n=1 Tax=Prosthecobacter sp. TaxID=1965333 RepID=UPI0024879336